MARKSETIRVAVVGACGRMGREVTKGVLSRPNLQLVAAVDVREVGKDIGEIVDGKPIGIPVSNDLVAAVEGKWRSSRC